MIRIFKNKIFRKWAAKEGLDDQDLCIAVDEIERGLLDADLGGYVVKKRIALRNKGKSGGVRTVLAYKKQNRAFFVFGFAKNVRSNLNGDELQALRSLAKEMLHYSDYELKTAIEHGVLIEVEKEVKNVK